MSHSAEQLLEFDRLKEIVSRQSTCAPGHRAIEELEPHQNVAALQSEFELIRESIAYLRAGSQLGFGPLADPEPWLPKLSVPASVLVPEEFLDVASLAESANATKLTLKPESTKYPRLTNLTDTLADFRALLT